MSLDVFLQSPFEPLGDDDRALAAEGAMAVLAPFLDRSGQRIATPDGGADIYGGDDLGNGFMVNHARGEAIWDVLVDVARTTGFVILPVGCGTCIPYDGMRSSIPVGFPEPVVVVTTGAELLAVIGSA